MISLFYVAAIAGLGLSRVNGFPTGAPADVCDSMFPGHGVDPQDSSSSPFTLTTDVEFYSSEHNEINFVLTGSNFKGFMVQVRNQNTNAATGTFTAFPPNTKLVDCGSGDALTHTNADDKTVVEFTWRASDIGDIDVIYTVVEDRSTIWVQEVGPYLTYRQCSPPCLNGGVCTYLDDDTEFCDCLNGYTGPTCNRITVYCPCEDGPP